MFTLCIIIPTICHFSLMIAGLLLGLYVAAEPFNYHVVNENGVTPHWAERRLMQDICSCLSRIILW